MTEYINEVLHLDNAPIVEAIIDFRIKAPDGFTADGLKPLQRLISNKYSTFEPARQFTTEVGFKDGKPIPPTLRDTIVGYRCESSDKLYVFQANTGGFTLSRLRPYQTWEYLRDEARWLWELYCNTVKPSGVLRTAVRYINRMEFRFPLDFDDYLACPPKIPANLPQIIGGFLSRIVVPYESGGIQVVITQALEAANLEKLIVPAILDIDIFYEHLFDIASPDYWDTLEKLRHLKNKAFFGSITKKTVEIFK